MKTEVISTRQAISMMSMFIIGSAIILGTGTQAKQLVWLSIIFALLAAIPVLYLYSKILSLFPGKDIFDICLFLFGGYAGRFIILLYVWYLFHLGALVLRNFSEFIEIVAIPETPQFVILLFLGILCIWLNKAGIEVAGRWATFVFPLILLVVFMTLPLSVLEMNFSNLLPLFEGGFQPIVKSAFGALTFPFLETVAFIAVLHHLKTTRPTFKVYFFSLLIGGGMILLVSLRNILVLGVDLTTRLYFPSYSAGRLISLDDFIQRNEVIIAINFLLAGIVKISICLYGACQGLAKVFKISDSKSLAVPIGLLMIDLALLVYNNIMEMFDWAMKIYPFYAIPFQFIIPLVVFGVAKYKLRNRERQL